MTSRNNVQSGCTVVWPGMQRWRAALALAFLLIGAPVASAQNTGKLAGLVVEAETGEPLPGASILITGTQLGTITGNDGRYFVIGVPVGTYDVRFSFVGFQSETVTGIAVSAGYTQEVDAALKAGIVLDEILVAYERPLIRKDAIGVPKIVSGEDLVNLPVRGVNAVASVQAGVVNVEGREELFLRGGRSRDVAYYVDGVKVVSDRTMGIGAIGVPQAAIEEQEMLIGNISARYGDVMSGIINVTTRSGGTSFFGSLEALTSEGLDPYRTTLFSASLGGPLFGDKLQFFVAAEINTAHDGAPRAVRQLHVDEDERARLRQSPEVLRALSAEGEEVFVELPGSMPAGAALPVDNAGNVIVNDDGTIVASDGSVIQLPAGGTLLSVTPVNAWEVIDPARFSMRKAQGGNGSRLFSGTANLTFKPFETVGLRLGGRQASSRTERIAWWQVLFAPEVFDEVEDVQRQAFATWTHYPTKNTFYQLQVDFTDRRGWLHDPRFSRDIEDLLLYGDLDHEANVVFTRFKQMTLVEEERIDPATGNPITVAVPTYVPRFSDSNMFYSGIVTAPGGDNTGYSKFHHRQWRFSGSLTAQWGLHQLEFGGEYEQRERRRWGINAANARTLAGWVDDTEACTFGTCGAERAFDTDGDGLPDATTAYASLPHQVLPAYQHYGYDVHGLTEAGTQDILGLVDQTNLYVEPWKPLYYGGYLQDKIEFRDIILNLGLRVDVFDNNALVYRDPFARVPIVRADAVSGRPSGIGADGAVYFSSDDVVGYRNRDGDYFNAEGQEVPAGAVVLQGTPRLLDFGDEEEARRAGWEGVFEDYAPQVTFIPRIGVSFPVTDRALFFGRYGVVSQRPSVFNYASLGELLERGNNFIPNPALRPEKTVEYEIGFRHRIGEQAALTISGFFRQLKDMETLREVRNAFPDPYVTAQNADVGTVKGLEFGFDLRRTRHLALNVNYTLSFADGTGSNVFANQFSVFGGVEPPINTFPLDFDQRHRLNLSLDVRFGRREGPMLGSFYPMENIGVNVLVQAGSGFPYTERVFDDDGRVPLGPVNAQRMPASSRVDLRLDRRFEIGSGTDVSVFLWIQNLLDTQNVFQVWQATGLPDNSGYLLTDRGPQFLAAQRRPETTREIVYHWMRLPNNYGIPRMIRLGARLTF